jgi:hypothetical protein
MPRVALSKPPNQKYCLVVSLLSVRENPGSQFRRDLSESLVARLPDYFFYSGHAKFAPPRIEGFGKTVAHDRKDIAALKRMVLEEKS